MQLIRACSVGAAAFGCAALVIGVAVPLAHAADAPPAPDTPGKTVSPVVAKASLDTTAYTDTDHVSVVTPVVSAEVGDREGAWKVHGQYLVDVISAASVDIVSTASQRWHEVRQAGNLGAGYKPKDFGADVSAAISREPDYHSIAGGGNLVWDFDDKNGTALLGYSYDHDTIGRTGTPFSVYSHALAVHTLAGGITLTLNRAAVLALVSDVIIESGDQSKPYRYIPMFSPDVAPTIAKGASISVVNAERLPDRPLENLPDSRDRYSLTARFGYRFAHGTLRADERLYTDTWRLHATTTELRYYANLSRRLMVWPLVRVHAQNGVYFWSRAYVSQFGSGGFELPTYRTGDRELGPLFSITGGLGGSFGIGPASDPSLLSIRAQADYVGTEFLDDLYVKSRGSVLGTLGLDGVFQ